MDAPNQSHGDTPTLSDSHLRALCQEMWILRTEGTMCDVILDVAGEQLRAHRVVLSAGSPFLRTLCVNPPAMSQDGLVLVRVDDFSYKVCVQLVRFLYTGKATDLSGTSLEEYERLCQNWGILGLAGPTQDNNDVTVSKESLGLEVEQNVGILSPKQINTPTGDVGESGDSFNNIGHNHVSTEKYIEDLINFEKAQKAQSSQKGRKKRKNQRGEVQSRRKGLRRTKRKEENPPKNTFSSEISEDRLLTASDTECDKTDVAIKSDNVPSEDDPYGGDTDVDDQTDDYVPSPKLSKGTRNDTSLQNHEKKQTFKKTRRKTHKKTKISIAKDVTSILDENSLQCTICNDVFESRLELEQHDKEEHKNKRNVWCKICKIKCADKNVLKAHDVEKHWKEGMEMPKVYACQEEGCSYLTYNCKSWFAHKNFVHQPERSICDLCGKSLKSEASLKQHKQLYHTAGVETKDFTCDVCHRVFRSQVGLERHRVMLHSASRVRVVREKHICPHCGMVYPTVTTMAEHLFKKHDITPPPGKTGYKCKHCDYKTIKPRDFKNHELRHYSEKQFACDKCGKSYTTQLELARHERLHTDSYKVHKCPHCEYSTKYGKGSLRSHILGRHQDNRPWSCSICSYSTKLKGNLHKHIRNVHKCEVNTNHRTVPKVGEGVGGDKNSEPKSESQTDTTKTSVQEYPPNRTSILGKDSSSTIESSREISQVLDNPAGSVTSLSGTQPHSHIDLHFTQEQQLPNMTSANRNTYNMPNSDSQKDEGRGSTSPSVSYVKNTALLGSYNDPTQTVRSAVPPGPISLPSMHPGQRNPHFNYVYAPPILVQPSVDRYGGRLHQSQFNMLESPMPPSEVPLSNNPSNPLMYSNLNL